jgi:cephalosporin hydroxylase
MARSFSTPFSEEHLKDYQRGVMRYEYCGVRCLKSPIDIAIYLRLLTDKRPQSIIEIGSKDGGSALLLRDFARTLGITCTIVSIDLIVPSPDAETDGITFIAGNALALNEVFTRNSLLRLPRLWLVIEDSAHTYAVCSAVLEFCARHLLRDDYLVMEDGILDDLGLSKQYDGGPNRAIREFVAGNTGVFEIDEFYCDMFGTNCTYNPHGYLRKT